MTETVVYTEHAERTTFGASCLWKVYRKTIPELSWGERSKHDRIACVTGSK